MTISTPSLEGKVAIVTGGGTGIGKAIVMAFAQAGATVVLCARNAERLERAAQGVRDTGGRALAVPADVSVKEQVDSLFQRTLAEFGAVDILLNSVVVHVAVPLVELREGGWDKVMSNDLKSYFLMCQAAARAMMPRKTGTIINMSSSAAVRPLMALGAYNVAKAGVSMLTRVFAVELAPHGIRVNAIGPDLVQTEASHAIWERPGLVEKMLPFIPMGRFATPGDIAGTALFLASDASAYITGQTIYVDGGALAR